MLTLLFDPMCFACFNIFPTLQQTPKPMKLQHQQKTTATQLNLNLQNLQSTMCCWSKKNLFLFKLKIEFHLYTLKQESGASATATNLDKPLSIQVCPTVQQLQILMLAYFGFNSWSYKLSCSKGPWISSCTSSYREYLRSFHYSKGVHVYLLSLIHI